jgi:hypothetical protein
MTTAYDYQTKRYYVVDSISLARIPSFLSYESHADAVAAIGDRWEDHTDPRYDG